MQIHYKIKSNSDYTAEFKQQNQLTAISENLSQIKLLNSLGLPNLEKPLKDLQELKTKLLNSPSYDYRTIKNTLNDVRSQIKTIFTTWENNWGVSHGWNELRFS